MKSLPFNIKDTRHAKVLVVLFVVIASSGFLHVKQAAGQAGIALQSTATHQFGQQIIFVAQLTSPVQVQSANIVIIDETQALTHVQPVQFVNGRSDYRFDTQQSRLHPFTLIRWYYELTLADGETVQSAEFSHRYDDNRYNWQTLASGPLHVFWAQGDAAFGQNAMNAAQSGLQAIGRLLPVDSSQPIEIYIYPTQSALALANLETWAVGYADPPLGVVLVAIEPDASQSLTMEGRIPHELMHVMVYRQVGAGYRNLPIWLNEGLATLAEINPTADYDRVLADASARDTLIPLSDLCAAFPADSASAFLAYAEARSFVTYLRTTYGTPALLNLAHVYSGGVSCDNGVRNAFGISLAQLESDWQESTLGQNSLGTALRNMAPYLVLLLLVILIPFMIGLRSPRQNVEK